MKKDLENFTVAILVASGFEQIEMTEPRKALEAAGAKTRLISPEKSQVQGWNHFQPADQFPVEVDLQTAETEGYDALLLPGGVINPDKLRLIPEAIDFIKKIYQANKPIAAICHGPWTLINAGAAKGHTMTSWPSLQMDLTNAGAKWVDKEVVQDKTILTSRKPDDIPAFNKAMIALFAEFAKNRQ